MDLTLFMFLFAVSFCLVALGLWRTEHSEFSIIGFLFIFLLSLNLLSAGLDYKTGENETTTFSYSNDTLISQSSINNYNYSTYENRTIGYWLAIGSFFGFLIMIVSLGKTKWGQEQ